MRRVLGTVNEYSRHVRSAFEQDANLPRLIVRNLNRNLVLVPFWYLGANQIGKLAFGIPFTVQPDDNSSVLRILASIGRPGKFPTCTHCRMIEWV